MGLSYSSHSRGKRDEKDLNHAHTLARYTHFVENHRRFPAVSETTGTPASPLKHKQTLTELSN